MFDPIVSIWVFLWTCICSYGLYLLLSQDRNAAKFYVYGKSLEVKNKQGLFWKLFLVPKRYFYHFYITSSIAFTTCLVMILIYYSRSKLGEPLNELSKFCTQTLSRYSIKLHTIKSLDSISCQVFVLILMLIQSIRRLYESYYVSVYSTKSNINIIHYLFGHLFYVMAALGTIMPLILSQTSQKFTNNILLNNLITKPRAIAFILFIYASIHQYKCHNILANLRKDKTGRKITDMHFAPSGGLFEYLSCPHYLLEVILYFIIVLVQRFEHPYWNLILMLVSSTQVINAMNEHKWYKKQYKDYPKKRKAILPMVL